MRWMDDSQFQNERKEKLLFGLENSSLRNSMRLNELKMQQKINFS